MKTLSKVQTEEKSRLTAEIVDKIADLEQTVNDYNALLNEQQQKVQEALDLLNEAIANAESYRQEINTEQEDYFDERSEKWQDGDAGQAYAAWMDQWSAEFEQVEVEFPEELEVPEIAAIDALVDLSEESS